MPSARFFMPDRKQLEFFLLRYVPSALKEEFVNIGLVLFESNPQGEGFADLRFVRDWKQVWCLDPQADIELLEAFQREIRGQLSSKQDRSLMIHRMQDLFSNTIQLSPVKACEAADPAEEIDVLARFYLERPKLERPRVLSGREYILSQMQSEFERVGIWTSLMHGIPVSPYTKPGDTFKFDFGYRIGNSLKLFHAVSLKRSVDSAVMLASRYPAIAPKMAKKLEAEPLLTAVIDDMDRTQEQNRFALEMMEEARITLAPLTEMPAIAETAKRDLIG